MGAFGPLDFTESLNRQKATESHTQLAGLRQRVEKVNVDLMRALDEARAHRDPDLTAEGLRKRREQMAELARQTTAKQLEQLQAEQRTYAARIQAWAESKRPTIGDDPVQLQKLSLAWDRARGMLDNGRPMAEVLAKATDPQMVLAIREWGPDYLAATMPRQPGVDGYRDAPDASGLVRSAERRLAELHGGDVKAAVGMLHDLSATSAGFESTAGHVQQRLGGGLQDPASGLHAAVQAHYAEQMAAAGYDSDAGAGGGQQGDAA